MVQNNQPTTVTAIFRNSRQARQAVEQLKDVGFTRDQIQIESDHVTGSPETEYRLERHPKTGTGSVVGAVIGALLGGLVAAGLLGLLPRIDGVLDTNELLTLLIGAGAGALLGLLMGAAIGRGRHEEVRTPIGHAAIDDRTVVTVRTSNWTNQADEILRRAGATDVQVSPDAMTTGAPDGMHLLETDEEITVASLPLAEERLVADKTERQLGTVRVRTEVEQAIGRLEVEAERDEVFVEHVPVGSIVSERRQPWDDDGTIVIPVYEEQLVVSKRLILREEIRVRRVPTTDVQLVEDTLRRDRLIVEDPDHTGAVRERFPTDRHPDEMYSEPFESDDELRTSE